MCVLWLAIWNVRTMFPILSNYFKQVDATRMTAIFDRKLVTQNLDITTFQETCLASSGSIREKDYKFVWPHTLLYSLS